MLDFAATDNLVHRRQESRFVRVYFDRLRSVPPDVFRGDESLVACLWPSDIDASTHARGARARPVRQLRAVWPEGTISIRDGSGFRRWRLMRRCHSNGVDSVLGWM